MTVRLNLRTGLIAIEVGVLHGYSSSRIVDGAAILRNEGNGARAALANILGGDAASTHLKQGRGRAAVVL